MKYDGILRKLFNKARKLQFSEFKMQKIHLMVLVLAVLVIVALTQEFWKTMNIYRYEDNGSVSSISTENGENIHYFNISLTQGDNVFNTKAELKLTAPLSESVEDDNRANDNEILLLDEIELMISEIENSRGEEVILPQQLRDDISVYWSVNRNYSFVWGLLFMPILFLLHRIDKKNKSKKIILKKKEELLFSLPDFVNKIILLSNAGMTLQDTINNIIIGYSVQKKSKNNLLLDELCIMHEQSRHGDINIFVMFNDYARKSGIRELSRISNMILESFYRGTDLILKIENERTMLWNVKMKAVKSKGKLAETKLLIPLSMLLVTLIIVTMAPAMLQL